ncbi:MAG: dihydrodipicolinate synthase family protein [Sedimentisphaerales bacterium]|nr:dihydrodipicolinate synthase family protein [Sedimentisphaerales bacterium]
MENKELYRGVVVPMLTPITEEGRVDLDSAARIARHIVDAGASVFVCGTTGEGPSIPKGQKIELLKTVVDAVEDRGLVYAGISDNCMASSIELAECFMQAGADVAFAHVPSFFPLSDEEVIDYYQLLAERSPLPLLLYNIPSMTKTCLSLNAVERLSYHPKIIGLKDSHADLGRLKEAMGLWRHRPDFVHLTGCTALSLTALLEGSDGIVPGAGNLFPGLFCRLYQAAKSGQIELAKAMQAIADRIGAVLNKGMHLGQAVAILKAMASIMGLCEPHMLPPLRTLDGQQIDELPKELVQIQALVDQI